MNICNRMLSRDAIVDSGFLVAGYTLASVLTANPIGILGGAVAGAAQAISPQIIAEIAPWEVRANRVKSFAITLFLSLAIASVALIGLGLPLSLTTLASATLSGVGAVHLLNTFGVRDYIDNLSRR